MYWEINSTNEQKDIQEIESAFIWWESRFACYLWASYYITIIFNQNLLNGTLDKNFCVFLFLILFFLWVDIFNNILLYYINIII
jgi:hypothetical protein